jgi:hypothetical protein
MKRIVIMTIVTAIMGLFSACEKCGHCETAYGPDDTACGKPAYNNAKKICDTPIQGGGTIGVWVDE